MAVARTETKSGLDSEAPTPRRWSSSKTHRAAERSPSAPSVSSTQSIVSSEPPDVCRRNSAMCSSFSMSARSRERIECVVCFRSTRSARLSIGRSYSSTKGTMSRSKAAISLASSKTRPADSASRRDDSSFHVRIASMSASRQTKQSTASLKRR